MFRKREIIKEIIKRALREDIQKGDITTNLIIPPKLKTKAFIFTKEKGIVCGVKIAKVVFKSLDSKIIVVEKVKDGDFIFPYQEIIEISGCARTILTGERTALNFLQRLSGIATLTHNFVQKVRPYNVKILDTRKTTPTLRVLEKYAVKKGGGENHRFSLSDKILIKGTHIDLVGIETAIKKAKRSKRKIEIEVRDLKELKKALKLRPDIIMLDNMSPKMIRKAVSLINNRAIIEVSGGVNLKNIREIAKTGVNWISIGRLTNSFKSLDMSLKIKKD